MEFNDPQSFERLTGLAYFTPAGQAGAIPLGNIQMVKSDYGLKTVDDLKSIRGVLQLRRRVTYGAVPIFSIDGNQFATPTIPLLLLGTRLADLAQASATASTFTFTSAAGQAFWVGAYNISNVSVASGGMPMAQGTDYFIDLFNGMVLVPVLGSGIPDGAAAVVTFDQAAFTLEQYLAFTTLSRTGSLVVFAEDEFGPPAKEIWTMQVSLTCKKGADMDPSKFRMFTLEAALLGTPLVQKRGESEPTIIQPGTDSLGVGGDTFAWQ